MPFDAMSATSDQIEISLNGESLTVDHGVTVDQLLRELGLSGRPVAVEINQKIAVREEHQSLVVEPGDVIEIVSLVGGG